MFLSVMAPGPELMARLSEFDLTTVSHADRVHLLKAWTRQQAWVQAQVAKCTAAVAPVFDATDATREQKDQIGFVEDQHREEVSAAIHLSPVAAQAQITLANELNQMYRATAAAFEAGNVSLAQVQAMVRTVHERTDFALTFQEAAQLERAVLQAMRGKTPARVRDLTRRALMHIRPSTPVEDHARARRDRRVELEFDGCGMATLWAYLPAVEAKMIYGVLDAKARLAAQPERVGGNACSEQGASAEYTPIGARRADALIELAAAGASDLSAQNVPDAVWKVNVVLDLPTALGMADNVAEISGLGPIPGSLARLLAADAKWTRWITDPQTGHLLDQGRSAYTPSTALRDYIRARDQVCRFPACHQPAFRCDIDHAIPWDSGGATDRENLGALCRRHHRLKTHKNWQIVDSRADGSCVWISPTGQRYEAGPNPALMPWESHDHEPSYEPPEPAIPAPTVKDLAVYLAHIYEQNPDEFYRKLAAEQDEHDRALAAAEVAMRRHTKEHTRKLRNARQIKRRRIQAGRGTS